MAIRVALVGTGNAGALALRQLIDDPRFELVAVSVSTPEKAGKDAGELAGLEVATGITAVIGLDGVIAARPDCVVYTAMGDTRPIESFNDCRRILDAGIVNGAPIQNFKVDKWWQIIDVNLTGTFLGIRTVAQPMIDGGGGSIINVSSVEGLRGSPWAHGYVASKWGVRGLAKSAALELAPHNVRVNSIHPGLIKTPMTEGLPEGMVKVPMGRSAESSEVSTFVVFLASDESSYATASEFVMDGGLSADVPHA